MTGASLTRAHRHPRAGAEPSQRQLRVGEEIRHALAALFAEGHLRDPALEGAQITVTEVKVSPDLKNVTAFVLPFGGGDAQALAAALNRAAPYLRGEIGRAVRLRFAPQIRFAADSSFDRAQRLERLFKTPEVARDLEPSKRADEEAPSPRDSEEGDRSEGQ